MDIVVLQQNSLLRYWFKLFINTVIIYKYEEIEIIGLKNDNPDKQQQKPRMQT